MADVVLNKDPQVCLSPQTYAFLSSASLKGCRAGFGALVCKWGLTIYTDLPSSYLYTSLKSPQFSECLSQNVRSTYIYISSSFGLSHDLSYRVPEGGCGLGAQATHPRSIRSLLLGTTLHSGRH